VRALLLLLPLVLLLLLQVLSREPAKPTLLRS
jgi:hypothetical protein